MQLAKTLKSKGLLFITIKPLCRLAVVLAIPMLLFLIGKLAFLIPLFQPRQDLLNNILLEVLGTMTAGIISCFVLFIVFVAAFILFDGVKRLIQWIIWG